MLANPISSTISDKQLKKAACLMLRRCLQHPRLISAGIYEGMSVSYSRYSFKAVECYRFEFSHTHQIIHPGVPGSVQLPSPSLIFTADELREILAMSDGLPARQESLLTQFTTTQQRIAFPPESDLDFYQSKVSLLMKSLNKGLFAPIFASLSLHSNIHIMFQALPDAGGTFKISCFEARAGVLELSLLGQISEGIVTQFSERPGKHYLCFKTAEAFENTCSALAKYYIEGMDYRRANRKQTLEIMGRLFHFYPEIAPHINLSQKQMVALGKAYVLGLHEGILLESSSGNRFLNFSQIDARRFQEICEKIRQGLGASSVRAEGQTLAISEEIAAILNDVFYPLEARNACVLSR